MQRNHFLLVKKLKNTGSAHLCTQASEPQLEAISVPSHQKPVQCTMCHKANLRHRSTMKSEAGS